MTRYKITGNNPVILSGGVEIDGPVTVAPVSASPDWVQVAEITTKRIDAIAYRDGLLMVGDRTTAAGGGGNIWTSDDLGDTWTAKGQATADRVLCLCALANGDWLLGQGTGWVGWSTNNGGVWNWGSAVNQGELVYSVAQMASGTVLATCTNGRVYRSTDNGRTFPASVLISSGQGVYRLQNLADGSVMVNGWAGRVWISIDDGLTWQNPVANNGYVGTANDPVFAIEQLKSGRIVVGSESGKWYRSDDLGVTWQSVFTSPDGADDLVEVGDEVFAATYYGTPVYVSTDGANSFSETQFTGFEHAIAVESSGSHWGIAGTYTGEIFRKKAD